MGTPSRSILCTAITGLWMLMAQRSHANNIQVSNASLTGNTDTYAFVQFDLSWENSWRGGGVSNWDAAWVFVKYKLSNGIWGHALLNDAGHTAPVGSQIDPGLLTPGTAYNSSTNPALGVFIYRSASGTGNLALAGVQLRWDFGLQGLGYNDIIQVQVHAIEVVYVTQGTFAAGSGGTENSAFTLTTINTASTSTLPTGTGSLGGPAGGYPSGQSAPTYASWPNGFNAFYCMKYELSQQAYVDFLNSLTYAQQVTRTTNAPNSVAGTGVMLTGNTSRNGIDIQSPGVASTTPAVYACNLNGNGVYGEADDGKDIASNNVNWGDQTAYLDWSGLRPMTELEFEKACRGTIPPLANEYAWGTAGITVSEYTLSGAGANTEGIATNYSTTLGNAIYSTTEGPINGPVRVGIFAANAANTGRVTAGASYYGIMELSGNLFEGTVTMNTAEGRSFMGSHGNGVLNAAGNPDGVSWPVVTTGLGSGARGGGYNISSSSSCVSDRSFANSSFVNRNANFGARGVRSAP